MSQSSDHSLRRVNCSLQRNCTLTVSMTKFTIAIKPQYQRVNNSSLLVAGGANLVATSAFYLNQPKHKF